MTLTNEIPEKVEHITENLLGAYPATNPVVVMYCAEWWYKNGKGGSDPIYQWCIAWLHQLNDNGYAGSTVYRAALDYAQDVGLDVE